MGNWGEGNGCLVIWNQSSMWVGKDVGEECVV